MSENVPDDTSHLLGRIVALELMMRGFMAKVAAESSDEPAEFVRGWKRDLFSSLQMVERATGEDAEIVWGEATTALNNLFDEVEKRVAGIDQEP